MRAQHGGNLHGMQRVMFIRERETKEHAYLARIAIIQVGTAGDEELRDAALEVRGHLFELPRLNASAEFGMIEQATGQHGDLTALSHLGGVVLIRQFLKQA